MKKMKIILLVLVLVLGTMFASACRVTPDKPDDPPVDPPQLLYYDIAVGEAGNNVTRFDAFRVVEEGENTPLLHNANNLLRRGDIVRVEFEVNEGYHGVVRMLTIPRSEEVEGPPPSIEPTVLLGDPNGDGFVIESYEVRGHLVVSIEAVEGERPPDPIPTRVDITGPLQVVSPNTVTFSAAVVPSNAPQEVAWSVRGAGDGAGVATINEQGILTPMTPGIITVVATAENGIYGTHQINILPEGTNPAPERVNIVGPNVVTAGQTITLNANISPANAQPNTVVWSVEAGTGTAEINSSTGVLTGQTAGMVAVRATVSGTDISNTHQVNVVAPAIPRPERVDITGLNVVYIAQTITLSADIVPANAQPRLLEWSSSDPNIATVSAAGVVTGFSAGTVTITATVTGTIPLVAGTHEVTVSAPTEIGPVVPSGHTRVWLYDRWLWNVERGVPMVHAWAGGNNLTGEWGSATQHMTHYTGPGAQGNNNLFFFDVQTTGAFTLIIHAPGVQIPAPGGTYPVVSGGQTTFFTQWWNSSTQAYDFGRANTLQGIWDWAEAN